MGLSKHFILEKFILLSLICSIVITHDLEKINPIKMLSSRTYSNLIENILTQNTQTIQNTHFLQLQAVGQKMLNISDFSINAILSIAQNSNPLNILAKNDTSNPLPVNIDTQDLNLLVDELNNYDANLNMSLRIYENPSIHQSPKIITDVDGINLHATLGMEFGVFINTNDTDATIVLDIDVTVHLKLEFDTSNKKLSVMVADILLKDINVKVDALAVNKALLKMSLTNFFKIAADGVKDMTSNIDVIGTLNDKTGGNYTSFDVLPNFGYTLFLLN